ncbi:hypothetical protein YC2023_071959 [Brassica napus]
MVDSEDQYSTEKASFVQSAILSNCEAEALSNSIRPSLSFPLVIKWRCCPRLDQIHKFRSVEVLLNTPPGSPKNSPEARGGSVRVQISLSRPVSFFMVKPRFCPNQDQSSPVKASLGFWPSPLRSTSSFSPRTLFLIEVVFCGWCRHGFKETPYSLDREDSDERCHVLWLSITRRCNVAVTRRTVGCRADIADREEEHEVTRAQVLTLSPKSGLGWWILKLCGIIGWPIMFLFDCWFPLLEARSWQEAKSNLVTVALGKDDRIAWSWTLGPPAGPIRSNTTLGRGRGVKFVTLTGLSLARHVALPDHGVGLDGQSCSCLIVGWPVGLSSPILGVSRPSVMFLFDCWPYLLGMKTLKWREFKAKPKPEAKEERQIQRTGQWYGLDRWEETKLRWERTSSVVGKTKIEKRVGLIGNEHGQDHIRAMSMLWQSKRKRMTH